MATTDAPKLGAVTMAIGTDAPLTVGLDFDMAVSEQVEIEASVGYVPSVYTSMVEGVGRSLMGYDETTGALIRGTIDGGMSLGARLRCRLLEDYGMYVAFGYVLVGFGGGLSDDELLAALGIQGGTGVDVVTTSAAVHMFEVSMGWQWQLDDHVMMRLGLGVGLTFHAATTVAFQGALGPLLAPVARDSEILLDDLIGSYFHVPMVQWSLGYRVFDGV
jgi:hypothetical protein